MRKNPPTSAPRRALLLAALLLHVLPFATRPALVGGDEPHYALAAYSLATDLDLIDDYAEVSQGSPAAGKKLVGHDLDHHVITVSGRQVFAHPIGLPALVAPLVWALHAIVPGLPPDLPLGLLSLAVTFAALVAGWRLLRGLTGSEERASWLVFVVYFCSHLWFYSRTAEVVAFAFGLAAASFFPIILLGIFDKRTNREGAIAGMVVGIVFTGYYIIANRFSAPRLGASASVPRASEPSA